MKNQLLHFPHRIIFFLESAIRSLSSRWKSKHSGCIYRNKIMHILHPTLSHKDNKICTYFSKLKQFMNKNELIHFFSLYVRLLRPGSHRKSSNAATETNCATTPPNPTSPGIIGIAKVRTLELDTFWKKNAPHVLTVSHIFTFAFTFAIGE